MNLRTKLVLLTSCLGIGVVVLALWLVSQRLMAFFTASARDEAAGAAETLDQSLRASLDSYRVEGRIVADETIIKEALVKGSIDLAFTYADSARDRTGAHYVAVVGVDGRVLVEATGQFPPGTELAVPRARPEATKPEAGFILLHDKLAAAAVVPITLGDRVLGLLLLGDPVNAERLRDVARASRASITLVDPHDGNVVSTLADAAAQQVAHASQCSAGEAAVPRSLELDGMPHLLITRPLVGLKGEPLGCIAITRSLQGQIEALESLRKWLVFLGALITMLAIGVGGLVAYRLVAPLRTLTGAARSVADGDLSQQEIRLQSADEIGQLAVAFNAMLGSLRELAALAGKMAKGDLTSRVAAGGEVGDAFNRMLKRQREVVQEMADASVQVAGAAAQIYAATQEQEGAATHQTAGVEEVSRTVQSLLESAGHIAESTRGVLGNAERTKQTTELMSNKIRELGTHTGRVAELLDVIREIADRSDLLALNASLEATRAGEAGRPFALVAAEMRRLAERVTGAVQDVKSLLADIKGSSNATILATEEGRKMADSMTDSARQITRVTQQQQTATEQVLQSLRHIASVLEESVSATQQTRASAALLKNEADRLKGMVGSFVLGPSARSKRIDGARASAPGQGGSIAPTEVPR